MHTRPRGTYHMPRSLGSRPGPRIVKLVLDMLNRHRSNSWGGEIGRELRRGGYYDTH